MGELQAVAGSVRTSIRALRSLLVDIYPATLAQAGLGAALADLAQAVQVPGLEVRLHHDPDGELGSTEAQERLVYRVAQETLRNAGKHAVPCTVTVMLYRHPHGVVLDVVDDGNGFDVAERIADPEPGHFGLQLLAAVAAEEGAAAPGRLRPRPRHPLAAPPGPAPPRGHRRCLGPPYSWSTTTRWSAPGSPPCSRPPTTSRSWARPATGSRRSRWPPARRPTSC